MGVRRNRWPTEPWVGNAQSHRGNTALSICSLASSHHTSGLPYLCNFTSVRLWSKKAFTLISLSDLRKRWGQSSQESISHHTSGLPCLYNFTSVRLWSKKSSTLISLSALSKQPKAARKACPSICLAPSLTPYPSDCLRAWTSGLRIRITSIHWALHLPYLTESSKQSYSSFSTEEEIGSERSSHVSKAPHLGRRTARVSIQV